MYRPFLADVTDDVIDEVVELITKGETTREIARNTGLTTSAIDSIRYRYRDFSSIWKPLSGAKWEERVYFGYNKRGEQK